MAQGEFSSCLLKDENSHFNERLCHQIAEVLHMLSEAELPNENENAAKYAKDDPTDTLAGWHLPKPKQSSNKKPRETVTESVINNTQNVRNQNNILDPDYLDSPLWKTCVEPTTYRYIVNNGKYRASKAVAQKFGHQRTMKLREKILNPEQKRLQKEIQQELRREFENQLQNVCTCPNNSTAEESYKPAKREFGEVHLKHSSSWPIISEAPQLVLSNQLPTSSSSQHKHAVLQNKPPPAPRRPVSPIELPAISVPLVSSSITNSLRQSESCSSNLDNLERDFKKEKKNKRSRGPDLQDIEGRTQRSLSEPPPPRTNLQEQNEDSNFELAPVSLLRRDLSSVSLTTSPGPARINTLSMSKKHSGTNLDRSSVLKESKEYSAWGRRSSNPDASQSDLSNIVLSNQGVCDVSKSMDVQKPQEVGSPELKRSSSKQSLASGASVPLSHIKYMAASGEVTTVPQFGHNSEQTSANFYKTLEKENTSRGITISNRVTSTKQYLTNVITTSSCYYSPGSIGPAVAGSVMHTTANHPHARTRALAKKESAFFSDSYSHIRDNLVDNKEFQKKLKGIQKTSKPKGFAKKDEFISDSSPAQVLVDSFRAMPLSGPKAHGRTEESVIKPSMEFLPNIAGTKMNMATATHRIV